MGEARGDSMTVDIAAIREAIERQGFVHRRSTVSGLCLVCDAPWPCSMAFKEEPGPDESDLLALCDLAERWVQHEAAQAGIQAAEADAMAAAEAYDRYQYEQGRDR